MLICYSKMYTTVNTQMSESTFRSRWFIM